jgi:hypothetical protein
VFLLTAYASFKKKQGDVAVANDLYQMAASVDPKQAASWQLAHDEGLPEYSRILMHDNSYLKLEEMLPVDGPLVLTNYQKLKNSRQP